MKKVLSGVLLSLLMLTVMPKSFASEEISVSLVSQSKLWLDERSNISFEISDSTNFGVSNAEFEMSESALLGRSAIKSVISKPNSISYRKIFETASVDVNENSSKITIPGSRLNFNGAGVYAFRITVYVRGEAKKLTSFISFLPKSISIKHLKVSTVLPMVVNAGLTPRNSILNDKAANSFLPNAGLNSVLTNGKRIDNVTWLVDADTLRLAQGISANRAITRPAIHSVSEPQISGANSWIENALSTLNYANTYLLPTGNVNAAALHSSGYNLSANLAIADSQYVTDFFAGFEFKTITIAPKGNYSSTEFTWLDKKNIAFNILNSKSFPASDSTYTPNGVVQNPLGEKAPVVDLLTSSLFSDAISSETNPGMFQAAFAGDLLITALEQPSVERFLVLMPDTNRNGITDEKFNSAVSALKAPWITGTPLAKFKDVNVGNRTSKEVQNKISKASKNLISYIHQTRNGLASLIDGANEESQLNFAILRMANESADQVTKKQLRKQTRNYLDRLNNAVKIMSSGSVVFPGESAKVPITVRNDLSVPIEIQIFTTGVPSVRVIPESVDDMHIAPGRRKSIEIPTRLIGTDTAYLQLQIVDMDGKRIGNPIQIQVSSSAYAQAAAWVVGAAFALLLVFAARNTLKRIRATRGSSRENNQL